VVSVGAGMFIGWVVEFRRTNVSSGVDRSWSVRVGFVLKTPSSAVFDEHSDV
jgi:hypothetical protein